MGYLPIEGLSKLTWSTYDERHLPVPFRRPFTGEGTGTGAWIDRPDAGLAYPDIAVPLELVAPFSIAAATNQAIWVDIYVPPDAPAGDWTGAIEVRHGDALVGTVPVSLEVWDFDLPDATTTQTMVYFSRPDIGSRYLGEGHPSDPAVLAALEDLEDAHFQLARRHRIDLIDAPWTSDGPPGGAWIDRLSGDLFTPARGYRGPGEGLGQRLFSLGTYGSWSWLAESTEAEMVALSDSWKGWFDVHAPDTEVFLYLIDESVEYDLIERWAGWLDGAEGGGLPTFATASLLHLRVGAPSLDIGCAWAHGAGDPAEWPAALDHFGAHQGRRLCVYNGKRPWAGSFATEDAGAALRANAWIQHKLDIDWWFYWESTYYDNYQGSQGLTDVFQRAQTFGSHIGTDPVLGETGWNYTNGDGVLFYPGTDLAFPASSHDVPGPFASLRLKHWRRGLQDVEYAVQAALRDPAATAGIIDGVVPAAMWELGVTDPNDPTWVHAETPWSQDPEAWEAARHALAALILAGPPVHLPGCDDADGDGVCDPDDACWGEDDTADTDGDGRIDGCQPCFVEGDADGDDVCDPVDTCPDLDDADPACVPSEPEPEPEGPPSAVWVASGQDKVHQTELRASADPTVVTSLTWDGNTAALVAARNEVVGLQVVIEAEAAAVVDLDVHLDALIGPQGGLITATPTSGLGVFDWVDRDIEHFAVGYLPILGLSRLSYETYDERHIPERFRRPFTGEGLGTGTWDDRPDAGAAYPELAIPLEWAGPLRVAAGTNQAVWIDVYVPRDAEPGVWTGEVSISHAGGSETLPVSLEVLDLSLPDAPALGTLLYQNRTQVGDRYVGETWPSDPEVVARVDAIEDRHHQLAHRHGITLIGADWQAGFAPSAAWNRRLDGTLYTPAAGYRGPGEGHGNEVYSVGTYGSWGWWTGTSDAELQALADGWDDWFEANHPAVDRFLYLIDESILYSATEAWAAAVDAAPGGGLPTFATASMLEGPGQIPSLDTACTWAKGTGDPALWEAALDWYGQPGRERCLYNAARPWTGSFATEDDGTALLATAWTQHKLGIDRWFFWESTYYDNSQGGTGDTNVFQQAHTFGGDTGPDEVVGRTGWNYSNGDGVLFYPGTDLRFPEESYGIDGPIASLRLKHWRRGLQDGQYLALAAAIDPDATAALVAERIPSVMHELGVADLSDPTWVRADISWSTDPDDWAASRDALAAIILSGPADALVTVPDGVPVLHLDAGVLPEPGRIDLDHVVTVTSPGRFEVGFESSRNYGLSRWFDLVADPDATTDLLHYTDEPDALTEQGALCNQVIYPDDTHLSHRTAEWAWPDLPRGLTIEEQSPLRVILSTTAHPVVTSVADEDLTVTTRWTLYATGQLFVATEAVSAGGRTDISEWRHCVIGTGDPTYVTVANSGSGAVVLSDTEVQMPAAAWSPDQWVGHRVRLPGWLQFHIVGNTADTLTLAASASSPVGGDWEIGSRAGVFGWLRGVDHQHPYDWSGQPKSVLFQHWDPATPSPWTDWTRASLLLSPAADNPWSTDDAATHEWVGFKRHHLRHPWPTLEGGEPVTNRYMMQLGTAEDDILPDIGSMAAANARSDDYRVPPAWFALEGSHDGFAVDRGAHQVTAADDRVLLELPADGLVRHLPVFEVSGYDHAQLPLVSVVGSPHAPAHVRQVGDTVLVHLIGNLEGPTLLRIGPPGSVWPEWSPPEDTAAPVDTGATTDTGTAPIDDTAVAAPLVPDSQLPVPPGAPALGVAQTSPPLPGAVDLDHRIEITSPGRWRLAFASDRNYGLSAWYDLLHDPDGLVDLAHIAAEPEGDGEQGALCNHTFDGSYTLAHKAAGIWQSEVPRSATVLEHHALRAVVETTAHPVATWAALTDLTVTHRWVIYGTGEVYVTVTVHSESGRTGMSWSHCVAGVGDPSYANPKANGSDGELIDPSHLRVPGAAWAPDAWAGHRLFQPGYRSYDIVGNTADTLEVLATSHPMTAGDYDIGSRPDVYGWLRGVDHQHPYTWSGEPKTLLFQHWDPATPAPWSDWTHASLLIAADPTNPVAGDTPTHAWDGFKRHLWTDSVDLPTDGSLTQRYLLQLGTEGDTLLPNIDGMAAANTGAATWFDAPTATVSLGSGGAFDRSEGAWMVTATGGAATLTLDGTGSPLRHPVIGIVGAGQNVTSDAGLPLHVQSVDNTTWIQLVGELTGPVQVHVVP